MVLGRVLTDMTRPFGMLALVLAVSATPSLAQDAAVTVGVFNAERVLAESQAGQQALALFNQLRDQRARELQAQQDEFNSLRLASLQAPAGSPDAAAAQRQLEDKSLQLQRLNEDVQDELGARQAALTGGITQSISVIIDALGTERGYTLIFNSSQSGLVFVDMAVDLTDEIITRLNAELAGGGG